MLHNSSVCPTVTLSHARMNKGHVHRGHVPRDYRTLPSRSGMTTLRSSPYTAPLLGASSSLPELLVSSVHASSCASVSLPSSRSAYSLPSRMQTCDYFAL